MPVVGCGTDELPGFFARESGLPTPMSVGTPAEAAALARRHWGLGLTTGLVFAVPVPESAALPREEADGAIDRALAEAHAAGIQGPAATPWVLRRVAELTDGRRSRPTWPSSSTTPRSRAASPPRWPPADRADGRCRLPRSTVGGAGTIAIGRSGRACRRHQQVPIAAPVPARGRLARRPHGPAPDPGSPRVRRAPPDRRHLRPRHRRAGGHARLQGEAGARHGPRRHRPGGRAGRVLRPARAERRGQDDAHQDPHHAAPADDRHGPRLRLRRGHPDQADPPDHEHGRRRRAVGLRHPDRPRAALDVQPVLRPRRARGLAPRRRADRGGRPRRAAPAAGRPRCRPASARR